MKKLQHGEKYAAGSFWRDWSIIPILEKWIQQNPEKAGEWYKIPELFEELRSFAVARNMMWRWDSSRALANHLRSFGMLEQIRKEIGVQMRWSHVPGQTHLYREYQFGANLLGKKPNPSNGE
jgi:hypothetical protein